MRKLRQEPAIFNFEDAGKWLESVYQHRKNKNENYSLRSFALALDLSHTVLTRLLQGKTRLSPENVAHIGESLDLTEPEMKYFEQIALASPNKAVMDQLKTQATAHKVEYAQVSEILNLKTIALLQMVERSEQVPFQLEDAAQKLSMSVEEIKALLRKLKYHGMIEMKSGQPRGTGKRLLLETAEEKKALTKFYKAGFQMAGDSFDRHQSKERVIGFEFLAFDAEDLGEASQLIDECLNRLAALSKRSKNPSDIYYCNTVMFRLTEKGEKSA